MLQFVFIFSSFSLFRYFSYLPCVQDRVFPWPRKVIKDKFRILKTTFCARSMQVIHNYVLIGDKRSDFHVFFSWWIVILLIPRCLQVILMEVLSHASAVNANLQSCTHMQTAHPTSLLSSKSLYKSLHFCLKVYSLPPPPPRSPTSFSNPRPYDSSLRKHMLYMETRV